MTWVGRSEATWRTRQRNILTGRWRFGRLRKLRMTRECPTASKSSIGGAAIAPTSVSGERPRRRHTWLTSGGVSGSERDVRSTSPPRTPPSRSTSQSSRVSRRMRRTERRVESNRHSYNNLLDISDRRDISRAESTSRSIGSSSEQICMTARKVCSTRRRHRPTVGRSGWRSVSFSTTDGL